MEILQSDEYSSDIEENVLMIPNVSDADANANADVPLQNIVEIVHRFYIVGHEIIVMI